MKGADFLKRRAGLALPLSAVRSREDWGCGDMGAAIPLLDWMQTAGLSVLQLLPLNELAPDDACPYSAFSAFAFDPVYTDLERISELAGSAGLRRAKRSAAVRRLRSSRRLRFGEARRFKIAWLRKACVRFARASPSRRMRFHAFQRRSRPWLENYTLYKALDQEQRRKSWRTWPAPLRNRHPAAMAAARRRLGRELRFHAYVQWVLHEQWLDFRNAAARRGVLLFGDLPFGLSARSADVWSRPDDFDFAASMGAPPDRYSASGQAWGLPAYRWTRMEREGHRWWRARIRRAAEHFDFFRLDHAVGFFRTWLLHNGKRPAGFDISGKAASAGRGRRFFRMALRAGKPAIPVAEDLGVIPPYVPPILRRLGIPGQKVLRWERRGKKFIHPRSLPALSMATTSNHDVATLASWWSDIPRTERDRYWSMVTDSRTNAPRFSAKTLRRLLENLFSAGSALALVPLQDLLGSRQRINVPGVVSSRNWTYRMPFPAEELERHCPAAPLRSLLNRNRRL